MAGSYNHIRQNADRSLNYRLLENMGDALEAVEELWLMLQCMARDQTATLSDANGYANTVLRGELPWPEGLTIDGGSGHG